MIQNLFNEMTELLRKQAPDFFVNDKLNKNKVTDAAYSYDKNLLKALLTNESLKKQFFVEVEKNLVFKQREFLMFLNNKSFLQDSYTRFKNEIGLQDEEGRYFRENNDVVLVWPHKDCILEGGQTKEDQSREEVFYNETLAPDEIDRLLDTKALTNFALFDKNGKKVLKANTELNLREQNLIIRGNNLLALHSLKARKEIAGKVKLIYIDPPYNREAEAFYNDKFKNSSWLTFMKNRLETAKTLLKEDGFICIQIDDYQLSNLLPLCDEVFTRTNRVNIITVKMSETSGVKMAHVDKKLPKIKEFILVYKKSTKSKLNPLKIKKADQGEKLNDYLKYYRSFITNPEDEVENWEIVSIGKYLKENNLDDSEEAVKQFQLENAENVVYRTNNKSFEKLKIKGKLARVTSKTGLEYIWWEGKQMLFLSDYIEEYICDLWTDISTINLNKEGGVDLENGKKPEKLIKRIIQLTTKEKDLVIDYHLGSGTTAAVALKLNRRFIGIEQLDYGENDSTVRLNNVINGDDSGISTDEDVKWTGGGQFLYCELKELNQKYINAIQSAKKTNDLWKLWGTMKSEAFLRIEIDKDKFTEDSFKQLELDEQKRLLLETLDKNHLYVNLSEMEDEEHKMNKDEIELNKKFYNIS
ncbi:MAG: DNA methyltransferase [Bacteroidales bacterium]